MSMALSEGVKTALRYIESWNEGFLKSEKAPGSSVLGPHLLLDGTI